MPHLDSGEALWCDRRHRSQILFYDFQHVSGLRRAISQTELREH